MIEGLSDGEARRRYGDRFVEAVRFDVAHPPVLPEARGGRPGPAPAPRSSTFSSAQPRARQWPGSGETVVFPSKMEAAVFDRLAREVAAIPGARLYRQVPLALLSIAPNGRGVPFKLTVDFAIVVPGQPTRYVEAKSKRKSREWVRGAAAARAAGFAIEETDR